MGVGDFVQEDRDVTSRPLWHELAALLFAAVAGFLLGMQDWTLPPPTHLEVWPEVQGSVAGLCESGWIVHAEYNGTPIAAACATEEQARALYAVLAGRMRDGR